MSATPHAPEPDAVPPTATRPDGAPTLVAIASGKGGVGKTWLAITLAQSLAVNGRRVLLVDCDFGLANIDIQLGLTPRHDLSAVLAGQCRLADVIVRHRLADLPAAAFDILPGRSGAAGLTTLDGALLGRLLRAIRRLPDYDTVLLDLGAGIDPSMRFLAAAADTLLVVSTDEPTALADAYAVLKLQARDRLASGGPDAARADVRLVINQSGTRASGQRTYDALARACTTFLGRAPVLAGIVRKDRRVPESIRHQTSLLVRHPTTPAAEDVGRLAAALL